MNFKKDKYTVINEAYIAALTTVSDSMANYSTSPISNIQYVIEVAISNGIREAIRSLVDNMYTNEDFEKDLFQPPKT